MLISETPELLRILVVMAKPPVPSSLSQETHMQWGQGWSLAKQRNGSRMQTMGMVTAEGVDPALCHL